VKNELPWYRELTRYHWFVFVVAALGWLFDCLDQQLFNLARKPAMHDLLQATLGTVPDNGMVDEYAGHATAIFLMGWAIGGLFFGILGDRIGRAKTMMFTILIYSVFTGFSAFATRFADFALWRFMTGLGVGGEFAVGVALVAEAMPQRARPFALGLLQALSAVGNITAAFINIGLGQIDLGNLPPVLGTKLTAWRIMFVVGTLPALLAILIRRRLKEPEQWQHAAHDGTAVKKLGSFRELFGVPQWRRNALVGLTLAFAGVVGLWGIGFFSFDLLAPVFRQHFESLGMSKEEVAGKVSFWIGITSVMQNLGGFFGIYAYSRMTHIVGRKPAFAAAFIAAALSTGLTFWFLDDFSEIFWMIPLMGFCQLSLFGGYAIYFPELFPTRLRSTGTSFCYNVGRFVAAVGPTSLGMLTNRVFIPANGFPEGMGMRYAGVSMCSVFLLGLLALPFAPETRGQPLPE
jgi:MFS family permease